MCQSVMWVTTSFLKAKLSTPWHWERWLKSLRQGDHQFETFKNKRSSSWGSLPLLHLSHHHVSRHPLHQRPTDWIDPSDEQQHGQADHGQRDYGGDCWLWKYLYLMWEMFIKACIMMPGRNRFFSQQTHKPKSYASSKLRPTNLMTDRDEVKT